MTPLDRQMATIAATATAILAEALIPVRVARVALVAQGSVVRIETVHDDGAKYLAFCVARFATPFVVAESAAKVFYWHRVEHVQEELMACVEDDQDAFLFEKAFDEDDDAPDLATVNPVGRA